MRKIRKGLYQAFAYQKPWGSARHGYAFVLGHRTKWESEKWEEINKEMWIGPNCEWPCKEFELEYEAI